MLHACSSSIRQVGAPTSCSSPELPLTIHCAPEALPTVLSCRATLDILASWQGALSFRRVPDIASLWPCSRRAQHRHRVDAAHGAGPECTCVAAAPLTAQLSKLAQVEPFAGKSYKLQGRSARVDMCCSFDPTWMLTNSSSIHTPLISRGSQVWRSRQRTQARLTLRCGSPAGCLACHRLRGQSKNRQGAEAPGMLLLPLAPASLHLLHAGAQLLVAALPAMPHLPSQEDYPSVDEPSRLEWAPGSFVCGNTLEQLREGRCMLSMIPACCGQHVAYAWSLGILSPPADAHQEQLPAAGASCPGRAYCRAGCHL